MVEHDPSEQGLFLVARDIADNILNGDNDLLLHGLPVPRVINCGATHGRMVAQRRIAGMSFPGNRVVQVRLPRSIFSPKLSCVTTKAL
ncbi:hypothetical protein H9L39_14782 [Fusarium oxysporum f. sp. albedinis]|nr:hypothetical protein H9L39_14782 [Fusarium oxysporum f. sp. albedinis]